MKKVSYAALAALVGTSLIPAPAYAAKAPYIDTSGTMTPQQVCDAQLRPADPAKFVTVPDAIQTSAWENVGDPIQGSATNSPSGYGTPSYSNVFATGDGAYFRNGGSPNVWGSATATVTYPQTQQMFSFSQNQKRTTTFDCLVSKNPAGPEHGPDEIQPAGLQSQGNSVIETQLIPLPDQNVITNVPFVVTGVTVNALICISPNNTTQGKPGTWVGKNGFLASNCQAASDSAGGTVPSNNAPMIP
jgi:hypothetical protein